ncbi:putative MFS family arabinose efflux permease [Raoultella sp. BIGb0138]|uniref:MFS transporter n=1 Tax=Raoultella sp. BIGb0138 TaxID=2485115 RepID=UPI0010CFDBC4|nr:MFS transporter [Raoultella sp. BIGb0138]TCW16424.1 putative MFS family arabinose efflux permease [Raoultella sp. BIGb0138]
MDSLAPKPAARPWLPIVLASLILLITMGIRQTVGLFVHPLLGETTMNIAEVSMALAIGQLMWGAFQPLFGAWADKRGALGVLIIGALLIAFGQLLTLWATSFSSLTLAQGLLSPAGAAAGSFSVLIGIVAGRLPADKGSMASGLINAGGSLGQFIFAPLVQLIVSLRGMASGLIFLAVAALATLFPAWLLCRDGVQKPVPRAHAEAEPGLKQQIHAAFRNPSYLLLHIGFLTCGFHVAFLTTHLPGEVTLCGHEASVSAASLSLIGLCNIAGSIFAGLLGKRYRMKYILAVLYASRAVLIGLFLASDKSELDFYLFAAAIGFTWLATVPPTAGIVGKLFGTRYLATLFGFTLFSHQIGAFFGACLGGLAMARNGNLDWVWYLDIALALLAALVNLPIKEKSVALRLSEATR